MKNVTMQVQARAQTGLMSWWNIPPALARNLKAAGYLVRTLPSGAQPQTHTNGGAT